MKKIKEETTEPKIYRYKSQGEKVFQLVRDMNSKNPEAKILLLYGKMLDDKIKFQLKAEALAFKSTMLFKLITTAMEEEMKKNIIEDAKTLEQLDYYRAVLADRLILEQEIDKWSKITVKPPKIDVDTKKYISV